MDPYFAGRRDEAMAAYERWLPLINYENRQCGLLACKVLMKEGGVIRSDSDAPSVLPLHPATRAGLIEIARRSIRGAALGAVINSVMARLVPAIHDFIRYRSKGRGCPAQGRARRTC